MGAVGKLPEAHASFSFAVSLGGQDQTLFTECTLPNLEVDVLEQQEGGYNQGVHLLPGRVKAGRIVLKGGLTRSKEMLKWYQDVVTGKLEAAKKQIDVIMYDSQGAALMTLTFAQAYPVKWTGPSFRASESAIAIETLELAFSEVTVS